MQTLRVLILPGTLALLTLSGCTYGSADLSVSSYSFIGPSPSSEQPSDATPDPAPGYNYYSDNWYDTGNQRDHGQFSNW